MTTLSPYMSTSSRRHPTLVRDIGVNLHGRRFSNLLGFEFFLFGPPAQTAPTSKPHLSPSQVSEGWPVAHGPTWPAIVAGKPAAYNPNCDRTL